MALHQHKIMRQVLELHGCPEGSGAQWQAELRDMFYERLLPQIEQACSRLATPGGVNRIGRLEIDLGQVSPDRFEAELGDRLEARLGSRLADAIDAAPPADTDLELVAHFIDSGALPWWADATDRDLLQAHLQRLIEHNPQGLRQCLLDRAAQGLAWRRLSLNCTDALLGRLVVLLAPGARPAWLVLLGPVAGLRGEAGRKVWWEETLRAFGAAALAGVVLPGIWRSVLARVARRLGSDDSTLRAEVQRSLAPTGAGAAGAKGQSDTALAFWREFGGDAGDAATGSDGASSPGAAGDARLLQALRLLEAAAAATGGAAAAGLWARLREVLHRLPAPLRAQAVAAMDAPTLAALQASAAGGSESGAERSLRARAMPAWAALVRAAREQGLVAPGLIDAVAELAEPLASPTPGADAARRRPADAPARSEVSAFSTSDTLQVHNAGLVVLWPFLTTFFDRLGLTGQGRFKDGPAAQRAVGLLQYLAAADTAPPEPLLPLNKVLCGLAPETVFDFGPPFTTVEMDECDALLAAVIQQAPVLGAMSAAGFRGSFLLRQGRLGGRDGHWLLRVERLTHDIVLDRFPWGVQFVKLPWMDAVMQVEW